MTKLTISDNELMQAFTGLGAEVDYAQRIVEFRAQIEAMGINTPNRWACFIGQCAHESAGFTVFEENLYYSYTALMKVWPSRFPNAASAKPYHRKPEAIANKVYGGRMGNDTKGDGYLYRGRGPIQLTGKDNYIKAGTAIRLNLVEQPSLVSEDPVYGIMVAAWFFSTNKKDGKSILEWADNLSHKMVTRIINGGYHGLNDRIVKSNFALSVFGIDEGRFKRPLIRLGDRSDAVLEVQRYLKALGYLHSADKVYGPRTQQAIIQFQKDHGLVADGIVGGTTYLTLTTHVLQNK